MTTTKAMKRFAAGLKNMPPLLGGGIFIGVVAGLAVGAMIDPLLVGLVAGALFGGAAGATAGLAMDGDDRRATRRTRQLDDIIGVTSGSMGTPPKSIPPGDLRRDPETALELESWARQWLTPPPPMAR